MADSGILEDEICILKILEIIVDSISEGSIHSIPWLICHVSSDLFKFLQFFPFFQRELDLQRMLFFSSLYQVLPISTGILPLPTYVAFFKCNSKVAEKFSITFLSTYLLTQHCSFGNLADTYHKEPSLDSIQRGPVCFLDWPLIRNSIVKGLRPNCDTPQIVLFIIILLPLFI